MLQNCKKQIIALVKHEGLSRQGLPLMVKLNATLDWDYKRELYPSCFLFIRWQMTKITHLPNTPASVLQLSTSAKWLKLNAILLFVKIIGCWKRPKKGAATAAEEMTRADGRYWVYKCNAPIMKAENKGLLNQIFAQPLSNIVLPAGFQQQRSATIGAAGDLLQSPGLGSAKNQLFEKVSDLIFDQTISYANLESPITKQDLIPEIISDRGPPMECCNEIQFDALTSHHDKNFTVLNTANNHILDMGVEGILTTIRTFHENGILDVGTNSSQHEYGKGKILEKEGIKFGFVSATFGLNGRKLPPEHSYLVNISSLMPKSGNPDLGLLIKQIENCKKQQCDFIIASLHWGFEFEFFPRQSQVDTAHELVEMGVDAILAHHPHVVQPVECYKTKRDPCRIAIIAYSLGSTVWGYTAPHIALSMILNLKITKGILNNKSTTYIETAKATPIFRKTAIKEGRLETQLEKLLEHSIENKTDSERHLKKMKQYCQLVLGRNALSLNKV